MASTKFTLSREVRNEITQYIDREFINELLKEIVKYIKTTGKAAIDDSSFNERDTTSRVSLIDSGSFNVYEYMYTKDFLEEISWEGSYVNEEIEDDETHDYIKVFKYEPKDIGQVIYEKVQNSMEQKKSILYKEFKSRYTDEFLFNSVRFYKRTRDGKVYYDVDIQQLNPDKKRSLEDSL